MSDETDLTLVNEAAFQMGEEILAAGYQIASRIQKERGLTDFETSLAAGNAYQRILTSAWSVFYDLDGDDLAPKLMRFLKDYLRDTPRKGKT